MIIGVPREIKNNENRVAMTPASVYTLVSFGHQVVIETNAGIGSGFVFVILLILGAIKNNNRMLVIIRGSRTKEAPISAVMFKFFGGKANMRVKNSTDTSIEFIYEITANMLQKAERKNNIGICDEIYKIGNIEYVNTVMQNDEISN